MHQRDNERLLKSLKELRDLGNTVIVVEHDEDMMRAADWIIEMNGVVGELTNAMKFGMASAITIMCIALGVSGWRLHTLDGNGQGKWQEH